ncbi:hypothetical protein HMPREF3216_00935 [Gardnerella vaginalis]|uniref:Uncharacterized protein n=1 Tax=Gardnerella vaginalis TaxID=2702 RepID=A0A133NNN8_GARVA|nr:hypothetical protein HMPREF3216_00935 [Gardnerella vaginalis]
MYIAGVCDYLSQLLLLFYLCFVYVLFLFNWSVLSVMERL